LFTDGTGNSCVWCPAAAGGACFTQAQVDAMSEYGCELPPYTSDSDLLSRQLGCTDPYAINYNPYAYAQRDVFGQGCPVDRDCCIYEGTKLNFSRQGLTEISLQPGSYTLTFMNNDFQNGGPDGFATFWEVFSSLSPLKHAPYTENGNFYITDSDNLNAEEVNQIRNTAVVSEDHGYAFCDPSDPVYYEMCTTSYWYHLTVYDLLTISTKFKYRIFKCGYRSNEAPPPSAPAPGPGIINPVKLKPVRSR